MTRSHGGPSTLSSARLNFALIALAMGGFAIGCTEFVAMGLLPNIAEAMLHGQYLVNPADANAHAGLMVSMYALGVVVGAPTIAASTARLPRKTLLLWLLVVFTLGTIFTALSPNFGSLLLFRFICGLPHGAYFGIASIVAADLLGPGKRGRGVAFVLTGLSVANVIGVPAITAIGENFGWRVAYVFVAALFATTFLLIAIAVPWQPGNPQQTIRRELGAFRHPQLWFALGMGAIGFGGFFALYTFIAPIVTDVAHLPEFWVPIALVMCGLGMVIGNLAGGHFSDRNMRATIFFFFSFTIVALVLVGLVASVGWMLIPAIFLVGMACSGVSPAVQSRLMSVAREAQSIAAALNHSAFNAGNSLGAYMGGAVVAAGLGYRAPIWFGVGLTVLGLIIAIVAFGLDRRNPIPTTASLDLTAA